MARYCVAKGITPAWAGKRVYCPKGDGPDTDYPRVGGEEPSGGVSATVQEGLPPRGRGRVARIWSLGSVVGITPAWAGKSGRRNTKMSLNKDYPRVGGEEGTKK